MKHFTAENYLSFTKAYMVCALWSSTDSAGNPLDNEFSEDDFNASSWQKCILTCLRFLNEAGDTILQAIEDNAVKVPDGSDNWSLAGHDFWLTHNGHGAGFWDGSWASPYDVKLTEISEKFPSFHVYASNGKLFADKG